MNIQFETKIYQTGAEMIEEAKARRKRFEIAGRLAKMKKLAPVQASEPVEIRFVAPKIPLWDQFSLNFDHHITEWHMRKVNPPLTYLKDRCAELGWSFTTITGPQRRDAVVEVRHQLMWEISERFTISLPQIGRMFGGRDHTTALYAIRKVEARMAETRA
jgi:hypothetical protein